MICEARFGNARAYLPVLLLIGLMEAFINDDSSGRNSRFAVVGFGSTDVAVLVSVSYFLAGMVEIIIIIVLGFTSVFDYLRSSDRIRSVFVFNKRGRRWSGYQMCVKLEEAVGAQNWLDMVTLYCRKFASEHREFAIKMNRLHGEIIKACQDRIAFVRELKSVASVTVTANTAMFLKEMMDKEASVSCVHGAALPRAIGEDLRLAREINALCAGLTAVMEERDSFVDELGLLVDRFVPEEMAEFLKESQEKDT
ncbi:hypothetical protein Tco_0155913 [Tanacetum coccineum]